MTSGFLENRGTQQVYPIYHINNCTAASCSCPSASGALLLVHRSAATGGGTSTQLSDHCTGLRWSTHPRQQHNYCYQKAEQVTNGEEFSYPYYHSYAYPEMHILHKPWGTQGMREDMSVKGHWGPKITPCYRKNQLKNQTPYFNLLLCHPSFPSPSRSTHFYQLLSKSNGAVCCMLKVHLCQLSYLPTMK